MSLPLDWSLYPNFKPYEFADGGPSMHPDFMRKLQLAREICKDLCIESGVAEIPFVITSGSRSVEENRRVGGKPDSTHLYGRACDIAAENSRSRFFITKSLLLAGFTRLGLSKAELFIHVDDGEYVTEIDKDKDVLWLY